MNKTMTTKSVIAKATILAALTGALLCPASAIADQKTYGYHKKDQHWQHHRDKRRAHSNYHIVRTDHRAVERRVAHHRAQKAHIAHARKHNRQHVRFNNRRDHYIHHYGHSRHYDRHRTHYHHYHAPHPRRHSHHSHDTDYLEWLAIMVLLDDIYDDDYP